MMHGRNILNQETIKPRNLGETLGRLGKYFGSFWYMIVLAVLFVIISTWTQVASPELMGQATDCFLVPAGSSAFAQLAPPTDFYPRDSFLLLAWDDRRPLYIVLLAADNLQRLSPRRIYNSRACHRHQ
jgi:ABC-type multidrug transport system fused ATPase/permease subunit